MGLTFRITRDRRGFCRESEIRIALGGSLILISLTLKSLADEIILDRFYQNYIFGSKSYVLPIFYKHLNLLTSNSSLLNIYDLYIYLTYFLSHQTNPIMFAFFALFYLMLLFLHLFIFLLKFLVKDIFLVPISIK